MDTKVSKCQIGPGVKQNVYLKLFLNFFLTYFSLHPTLPSPGNNFHNPYKCFTHLKALEFLL